MNTPNRAERRRAAREQVRRVMVGENIITTGLGSPYTFTGLKDLPAKEDGKHRFIVTMAWSVPDPVLEREGPLMLDHENAIQSGIGCIDCEEVWTPELSKQPCLAEATP